MPANSIDAADERAREAVERILARPEFDWESSGNWLQRLSNWINDQAVWIFQQIGNGLEWLLGDLRDWILNLPPGWRWLVVAWLVLCLLAIFAHFVYFIVTQFGGEGRGRSQSSISARVHGVEARDGASVVAAAETLLNAGRWADAIRHYYVAALLRLDEGGLVDYRESKTNSDYLRELRNAPNLHTTFRELTHRFDQVAYGGNSPTRTDGHEVARIVAELRRECPLG